MGATRSADATGLGGAEGGWAVLVEPAVDAVVVADVMEREYGRSGCAVQFIPAGETAWCYAATDDQGLRWFVKLSRPGGIAPARVAFAMAVSRALADLGLPVPRPLPTLAGTLGSRLGESRMAVFEFVAGSPLSDQDLRHPDVLAQAARLVAALHRSTPALAGCRPPVESLQVYPDGLRRCLAHIDVDPAGGLVREARELVWPRRAALLSRLQRLQALGDRVRSRPSRPVLCHGDLICDNLLQDRGGRLWLVDWDAAGLAPRELDVSLFTGRGFADFLDSYQRDADRPGLDPDTIGFFLLRRNLDDLVDWLLGALDNQQPQAQRRADLDGVRWCIAGWAGLDERIRHAREVLARCG
jgi:Ser/Thr protein kinase RdoA (MazF antagonist)